MSEAVNDAVLGVKLGGDAVKILRVAGLIASEYGVGDMIGQLDDARRSGIHEQRRVRKVPDDALTQVYQPKNQPVVDKGLTATRIPEWHYKRAPNR